MKLAKDGVYWSIQGEGHLRGFQMCFVRLAGCSIACPECDTDYAPQGEDLPDWKIAKLANEATPPQVRDRWVWITGGEPSDHRKDLVALIKALRGHRFSICVATAGHERMIYPVDWLSVSPHDPARWTQRYGQELKIVDGLNGQSARAFLTAAESGGGWDFMYKYVQPISVGGKEDSASLKRCLEFLRDKPDWSLSRQDHLVWGVP